MGLSAGFKWHDKEKEKDKDREKEKDKEKEKEKEVERSKSHREKEEFKRRKEDDTPREHDLNGWTAMCEAWLCNGGVTARNNASSPSVADVSAPKPLMRRTTSKEQKKGPYQLLVKERLMGIYMAIYIHRDVRGLVKGAIIGWIVNTHEPNHSFLPYS
jgi:outer membrane biosynthesis protein TonB